MEFYLWDLFVGRSQKNNTYRTQNRSSQLKLLFSLKKIWIRGTQEMFLEIHVWRYSEVWNLARQTIILLFLFHFKKMSHLSCVLLISADDSKSAVTEYWLNKDWNYIVSGSNCVFVLGSPFHLSIYLDSWARDHGKSAVIWIFREFSNFHSYRHRLCSSSSCISRLPGGVLGISSDGDDRMEPKVKTQKNP